MFIGVSPPARQLTDWVKFDSAAFYRRNPNRKLSTVRSRPSSVKSSSIKVRNLPKSKIIIVNVTVVGVMFRDRGQVRGELVGRTQHLHRTGRELPYQSLLVRHLVLTVNKKERKRLGKVSKQDFIFKA